MKASLAYFIISVLLLVGGTILLIPPAPYVGSGSSTLDIGYYMSIQMDIFKAGQVSGTFYEASGHEMQLFVLDSVQFDSFKTIRFYQLDQPSKPLGAPSGLFATAASSGAFSVGFPHPGEYYLVLDHGRQLGQTIERVRVNYRIDGINPTIFGAGLAALFGGVGLWILGIHASRTVSPRIPRAGDVIRFDQPLTRQSAPVPQATELTSAQPAQETESLQHKLERLEKDIQLMDQMRQERKPINLELFERTYSTKVEEAEETRRKMRAMEPLPAS